MTITSEADNNKKMNLVFSVSVFIALLFTSSSQTQQAEVKNRAQTKLLLNESALFFFYFQPTQTCKCFDARNLVLVRQCRGVTMATNPVHAHARPPLISLPVLTSIYQHVEMFSS